MKNENKKVVSSKFKGSSGASLFSLSLFLESVSASYNFKVTNVERHTA